MLLAASAVGCANGTSVDESGGVEMAASGQQSKAVERALIRVSSPALRRNVLALIGADLPIAEPARALVAVVAGEMVAMVITSPDAVLSVPEGWRVLWSDEGE